MLKFSLRAMVEKMSGSACGLRRLFAGSGLSVLVDFSGLIRVSLWCRRRPILLLCVVKRAPEDITTSVGGGGESLAWSNAHKGYGVQSEMWSSMASLWLIDVSYRFGPPMWSLAVNLLWFSLEATDVAVLRLVPRVVVMSSVG
ncbi:hypothetical protein F2Q69_00030201 [Brassica cretica]|uniref:Uncharacterized protein n=1 Tax=Brassica cretica TaxID=69181 RepID=A0A8S9RYX0_BRACR|nr:hypothetical protein F2Q69_00030201 [Brassica cretica]